MLLGGWDSPKRLPQLPGAEHQHSSKRDAKQTDVNHDDHKHLFAVDVAIDGGPEQSCNRQQVPYTHAREEQSAPKGIWWPESG